MKYQESELLIFNKHYTTFVRNYVHNTLDTAGIPHYIHCITDCSVLVYVDLISSQHIAERLLMSHPFAKFSKSGVDEDDYAWIEIYF